MHSQGLRKNILNYTIAYRIIIIMKVTALIPDKLIEEVKEYTNGKNITESLIKALSEWLKMQKIKKLNSRVSKNPLKFRKDFSHRKIRTINRI